ncbi:MAG: WecB/TagA/CpsF family glycosyltransferase [Patulibacter sp.]
MSPTSTVHAPRALAAPQVDLLGLAIHGTTEAQVIERILTEGAEGRGGWVCTVNLDILRQTSRDDSIHRLVSTADVVTPDGMPIIWASALAGTPLPARVAGSTLLTTLPAHAARAGRSLFLLGGNPGTAEQAAQVLTAANPGLDIAGTHCPPFGFEKNQAVKQAAIDAVVQADPDIVFVGLGFPKQERLIQELREFLPAAWFVSCGISFSFVSGEIARAPEWMQRIGMEWLHRMFQEPDRLVKRYLRDDLPFFAQLFAHIGFRRMREKPGRMLGSRKTGSAWLTRT